MIGLYKEISQSARSLRIYILQRIPMILFTFMEAFIGAFICGFPFKKTQKT